MIELENKIKKIKEVFDINYYLNYESNYDNIKKYYKYSHKFYRLFYFKTGQMHFPLYSKEKKKIDINEQCRIINKYLKKINAEKVLELGSGQGSNIKYLAKKNPKINFLGIDLYPLKKFKEENKEVIIGNYHDLSIFNESSFDLVYAIESLVYSNQKDIVFNEVNRILKQGGLFIIFDGYSNKDKEKLKDIEKEAMKLLESGMAVGNFENINTFEVERKKFKLVKKENYFDEHLPYWERFEKLSEKFINNRIINKIGIKFLSKQSLGNVISGNLGYYLFKNNYYVYMMHIYKKVK